MSENLKKKSLKELFSILVLVGIGALIYYINNKGYQGRLAHQVLSVSLFIYAMLLAFYIISRGIRLILWGLKTLDNK